MVDSALRLLRTPGAIRTRIFRMYVFLIAFNLVAWGLAPSWPIPSGCAMRSMQTTLPPSTTPPAS
jgi:hypothetical protein